VLVSDDPGQAVGRDAEQHEIASSAEGAVRDTRHLINGGEVVKPSCSSEGGS
jgi:hypothetical protein